jgi:small nuclear ribonucleoprotein (snRNP)-like protein
MNKLLRSIPLAVMLILAPIGRLVRSQQLTASDADANRIKTEIVRRVKNQNPNVTIRLRNGNELKGRITGTSENMFTLKEESTRHHRDINFSDVVKVKSGGLSRGAKFGILTGLLAGSVLIGALMSLKHSDPFENGVLH